MSFPVHRRSFCATSATAVGAVAASFGFNRLARAEDTDDDEMITQIAKFKLNMKNEEEAVQALQEMCSAVEESEPDVLIYICHRSEENPEEVVFFEVYQNADALKAHSATPHMKKLGGSFLKYFVPPLEVTRLDRIGGFSR